MQKELNIFHEHAVRKGLKHSAKRDQIVKAFLRTQNHLSCDDLCKIVKQENPRIGFTTVYRTLNLIMESGLAEAVDFNDGVKRFERKLGREYHAHLICTKCGKNFEAFDKEIVELNAKLTKEKGFLVQKHRFEIFGLCTNCQ